MHAAFTVISVLLILSAACSSGAPAASAPAAKPPAASPATAASTSSGAAAPTSAPSAAAAPAPTKVRAAYSVVAGAVAPVWAAKDLGYWEKYGLDVELSLISGAPNAIAALLAGDATFIQIAGDSGFSAQVRDPDIISILNTSSGSVHRMVVQPDIARPEDLRGKRMGVFTHGDGNFALISRALLKFGMNPERDVIWTPVGGGNMGGFVGGLAAGAIDGALFTPPTDLVAERNGGRVLFNYADLQLPSAGLPVYTYRRTTETQRPIVEAYMKGIIEGARTFMTDPQVGKEVLARWTNIADAEALEWTYRRQVTVTTDRPWLNIDQTRQVLETLAGEQPDLRELQLERVMDNSLLDGLERQGYFAAR